MRGMTLRLRLTLALVALLTVGLAASGIATYARYSRSEYQKLDQQLQSILVPETRELEQAAGLQSDGEGPGGRGGNGGGPGAVPLVAPTGTWGQTRAKAR